MTAIKNYYEYLPKNKTQPKQLVILLHGLGSNGRDLITLAPYWAAALPDAAFVSPDAPFPCDMVPPGYPDSFQWFSLQSRNPKDMLEGVRIAAPIAMAFIDEQLDRFKLSADKCALVGFSQGTMTSLYLAQHYKQALAGVLGYSGALLWDPAKAPLHKPPAHIIHGEADDVVPLAAYHMAKETLEAQGFAVSGHTTPGLPHSIDNKGIESGSEFLQKILL